MQGDQEAIINNTAPDRTSKQNTERVLANYCTEDPDRLVGKEQTLERGCHKKGKSMADKVCEDSHISHRGKSEISRFLHMLDRQKLIILSISSSSDKEQQGFSSPADGG